MTIKSNNLGKLAENNRSKATCQKLLIENEKRKNPRKQPVKNNSRKTIDQKRKVETLSRSNSTKTLRRKTRRKHIKAIHPKYGANFVILLY